MIATHYTIHPVADIMPKLLPDEMEALVADIKANGQLIPIIAHEGEIIDGRHRYWACNELGITPIITKWNGPTEPARLAECAVSLNVKRRHLTPSQRAGLATDALPYFEAMARERMLSTQNNNAGAAVQKIAQQGDHGKARDQVAELFNVNKQYVQLAKNVAEWSPETINAVKRGDLHILEAGKMWREATQPTEPLAGMTSSQRAAMAADELAEPPPKPSTGKPSQPTAPPTAPEPAIQPATAGSHTQEGNQPHPLLEWLKTHEWDAEMVGVGQWRVWATE